MEAVIDTLVTLLKIESLTGREDAICSHVHDLLSKRLSPILSEISIRRIKNSLIVLGPSHPDRQTICLAGHLDTVPGTNDVKITDGKVIGLGATDMKSGDAVMIELCTPEMIRKSRYNLAWVFYHSEEGQHEENGIHDVLRETPELKQVDLAFMLEPTDNTLHLGCVGSINADITFRGKRAHSARPWEGENAIHKAGRFLTRLSELKPVEVLFRDLTFREVISATIGTGGDATNIVPESFKLNINLRFAPGTSLEAARKRLTDLVANEADILITTECPSGAVPNANSILDDFQEKFSLPEHPKQAYTDVAMFALNGIDAVNFGPGIPSQAHQRGEYVPVSNVVQSYEMYRSFLLGEQ